MNYYNEFDPKAAAWISELITIGAIPPGFVDTRSIKDVCPDDLAPYTQCHFFAGIGGWAYALELAGWPPDQPVWTASCPCQPFSVAGKQMGRRDPRHVWPALRRLIHRCQPPIVFGEQVASKDGRQWLAGVFANLERMGYAPAGSDLCAAGEGSPQIRQRLYWMAYAHGGRCQQRDTHQRVIPESPQSSDTSGMGFPDGAGRQQRRPAPTPPGHRHSPQSAGDTSRLADTPSSPGPQQQHQPRPGPRRGSTPPDAPECGGFGGMENPDESRREGQPLGLLGQCDQRFWDAYDILPCLDGKARRVEPGTFPLADGVPGRVGLLRGYGNAIVPQVAANFLQACQEILAQD